MHDILFETQDDWAKLGDPKEYFSDLAKRLNLNVEQFVRDIDGDAVRGLVERDLRYAEQLGLNSTPSFFLNGKKMNFEDIRKEIEKV